MPFLSPAHFHLLLLVTALLPAQASGQVPEGYREASRITVRQGGDSAFVVLWLDSRINPASEPPPDLDAFRPAMVALIAVDGTPRSSLRLTRPVGRIVRAGPPFGENEVLVAEDWSEGAGSYRGWLTRIARVPLPGPIVWERVREPGTSWWTELRLMESGKDGWKVVGNEIHTVSSHGQDSVSSQVTLSRMRRISGGWTRLASTANGFWESDIPFPATERFPQWPATAPR